VVILLSVHEVRFDSHEILAVASPSSQTVGFKKSGVSDVAVSLS
jgi:hypothetical protein